MNGLNRNAEHNFIRWGALFAALPLSAVSLLLFPVRQTQAQAGADRYFEGTSASCVTVIGQTPVELKSARFTLDVPCYGACEYGERAPSVRADYTLYNPTQQDKTVNLAFPYELVKYGQNAESWNGQENCSLRAGEEDIDYSLHYSYRASGGFDAAACIEHFQKIDEFYTPDLTVTKYVYRVTLSQEEAETYVKIYLGGDPRSKVVRGEECLSACVENGYRCLSYRLSAERSEIVYYAIGGENEAVRVSCGKRERGVTAEELPFALVQKEEQRFSAFAERYRSDALSSEDWYRAAVDFFNDNEHSGMLPPLTVCKESAFVRWYLYSLSVPAGGMSRHTVTAPLYPASSPEANGFYYQLSPLSGFGGCGDVEIYLNTPYVLAYSSVDFEKGENGYVFSRETLPYGDLTFVIAQSAKAQPFLPDPVRRDPLTVAIVILAVLVAGSIGIAVVLSVKNKRACQKSEEARRRAEMGKPEEGRIDGGREGTAKK